MNRIEIFDMALLLSREKYKDNPNYFVLEAIIEQLEYLLTVAKGASKDLSRLNTIMIGRMAAHDLDTLDPKLSEILHLSASEARKMIKERGI